jgi:hypothetical protein
MRPVAGFRLGFISLLAAAVGMIAGVVAFLLYNLIGLLTNLAFYHVWSFHFRNPVDRTLVAKVVAITRGMNGVSPGDEVSVSYRDGAGKKIVFRIQELSSRP